MLAEVGEHAFHFLVWSSSVQDLGDVDHLQREPTPTSGKKASM